MKLQTIALAAFAAAASAQSPPNLTAALQATPELSNLTSYVSLFPDLLSTLGSAQNITILAPSNEAFMKFLMGSAGSAITNNDTAAIQAILQYHVLNGTYPASAVTEMPVFIPTMLMDESYANVTGGQVVEAVRQEDNVVFYSGLLNNSTVTTADVNFTGGVVHIIDTLLTIPTNISSTAQEAGLSAVVGALTRAELAQSVDSAGNLTIFVPNNEAFQAIGSILPSLSMSDLGALLAYHVVNGTVGYSSTLENGTSLQSLGGGNLTITTEGMDVFVNSAKVVTPDILVAEGVAHVIDNVLNPNATTAVPDPAMPTQMPVFSGASSAAENPLTSGVPTPTSSLGMGPAAAETSEQAPPPESSAAEGAAAPMRTGVIEAAALFAGAGILLNM